MLTFLASGWKSCASCCRVRLSTFHQRSRQMMQIIEPMREHLFTPTANDGFSITHDRVLTIGRHCYLVHCSEEDSRFETRQATSLATVIDVPQSENDRQVRITETWLEQRLKQYADDDVFRQEFLHTVVFHGAKECEVDVTDGARKLLRDRGVRRTHWLDPKEHPAAIRPGPYVLMGDHFRDVWRLHKDNREAFLLSVQPGLQKDFTELRVTTSSGGGYLDIAVPSRLRTLRQGQPPLAGMRIAVKDNFHLRGVRTSMCNRAYCMTYPPQEKTAESIQRLIDDGVTIVGKTKLSSFGVWEEPMEYIDYQAPWNPRADGYQSPGGSSSGSACSVAAYDWVDVAIGADTAGSIMRPALWAGIFGMRPTYTAVSNDGLVPSISFLDTPCFLARSLSLCKEFASIWYKHNLRRIVEKKITRIVWPTDYWVLIGPEQNQIAMRFVEDLEKFLGVNHTMVSFKMEWDKASPVEAGGLSLMEYIQDATSHIWYEDFHNTDEFRQRYWKEHGQTPYVSPPVRETWSASGQITKAQYDEGRHRLDIFKQWFNRRLMHSEEGSALFVIPIENLDARYRDETIDNVKKPRPGVNSLILSPILGTPELIVPIGEISYRSKVTGQAENLTFAVGLMSAEGTDLDMMQTIYDCLKASERPTEVVTGRLALPEGQRWAPLTKTPESLASNDLTTDAAVTKSENGIGRD